MGANIPFTPRPAPAAPLHFGPVTLVPGGKGGRYPYCHSLVLDGPEETWVIDPAAQRAYFTELARSRRVTAVFLSHFHEDHQRYNYLFPQAAFFGPALEEDAFRSIKGVFRHMGLKDPEFRRHWQETLERQFHLRPIQRFKPHFPGQLFQLGELTLEVLPAPGHTPGHSCFAIPELDLVYLADVDLTSFGP